MSFIQWIVDLFNAISPLYVIMSYQNGVRWTFGRKPKALGPGVHLKLWPVHEIELVSMVDDYMELPLQSVTTKDKKPITFSVGIGYRIVDAVKHYCEVTEFKEATAGIAMMHLAERVREQTEEELTADLKSLERSLSGTLTTRLKDWGTVVFRVGFVDYCIGIRTYRLLGGIPHD